VVFTLSVYTNRW